MPITAEDLKRSLDLKRKQDEEEKPDFKEQLRQSMREKGLLGRPVLKTDEKEWMQTKEPSIGAVEGVTVTAAKPKHPIIEAEKFVSRVGEKIQPFFEAIAKPTVDASQWLATTFEALGNIGLIETWKSKAASTAMQTIGGTAQAVATFIPRAMQMPYMWEKMSTEWADMIHNPLGSEKSRAAAARWGKLHAEAQAKGISPEEMVLEATMNLVVATGLMELGNFAWNKFTLRRFMQRYNLSPKDVHAIGMKAMNGEKLSTFEQSLWDDMRIYTKTGSTSAQYYRAPMTQAQRITALHHGPYVYQPPSAFNVGWKLSPRHGFSWVPKAPLEQYPMNIRVAWHYLMSERANLVPVTKPTRLTAPGIAAQAADKAFETGALKHGVKPDLLMSQLQNKIVPYIVAPKDYQLFMSTFGRELTAMLNRGGNIKEIVSTFKGRFDEKFGPSVSIPLMSGAQVEPLPPEAMVELPPTLRRAVIKRLKLKKEEYADKSDYELLQIAKERGIDVKIYKGEEAKPTTREAPKTLRVQKEKRLGFTKWAAEVVLEDEPLYNIVTIPHSIRKPAKVYEEYKPLQKAGLLTSDKFASSLDELAADNGWESEEDLRLAIIRLIEQYNVASKTKTVAGLLRLSADKRKQLEAYSAILNKLKASKPGVEQTQLIQELQDAYAPLEPFIKAYPKVLDKMGIEAEHKMAIAMRNEAQDLQTGALSKNLLIKNFPDHANARMWLTALDGIEFGRFNKLYSEAIGDKVVELQGKVLNSYIMHNIGDSFYRHGGDQFMLFTEAQITDSELLDINKQLAAAANETLKALKGDVPQFRWKMKQLEPGETLHGALEKVTTNMSEDFDNGKTLYVPQEEDDIIGNPFITRPKEPIEPPTPEAAAAKPPAPVEKPKPPKKKAKPIINEGEEPWKLQTDPIEMYRFGTGRNLDEFFSRELNELEEVYAECWQLKENHLEPLKAKQKTASADRAIALNKRIKEMDKKFQDAILDHQVANHEALIAYVEENYIAPKGVKIHELLDEFYIAMESPGTRKEYWTMPLRVLFDDMVEQMGFRRIAKEPSLISIMEKTKGRPMTKEQTKFLEQLRRRVKSHELTTAEALLEWEEKFPREKGIVVAPTKPAATGTVPKEFQPGWAGQEVDIAYSAMPKDAYHNMGRMLEFAEKGKGKVEYTSKKGGKKTAAIPLNKLEAHLESGTAEWRAREEAWSERARTMYGEEPGQEKPVVKPTETRTELNKAAKEHFGITQEPREAGYILDDGTMLDFSGRHYATGYKNKKPVKGQPDYLRGQHNVDHREIAPIFKREIGGSEAMIEFEQKAGAIRFFLTQGNDMNVDFCVAQSVTQSQWQKLAEINKSDKPDRIFYDIYAEDGKTLIESGQAKNIGEINTKVDKARSAVIYKDRGEAVLKQQVVKKPPQKKVQAEIEGATKIQFGQGDQPLTPEQETKARAEIARQETQGSLFMQGQPTTQRHLGEMEKPVWATATKCPKCGAKMKLGEGFERVTETADESTYGVRSTQVQCEKCNTYFGTINEDTGEVLDIGWTERIKTGKSKIVKLGAGPSPEQAPQWEPQGLDPLDNAADADIGKFSNKYISFKLPKKIKKSFGQICHDIYTQAVDRFHPIARLVTDDLNLPPLQDPKLLIYLTQGWQGKIGAALDGFTWRFNEDGTMGITGPGLKSIIRPFSKNYEDIARIWIADRMIWLAEQRPELQGELFGRKIKGIDLDDAKKLIADMERKYGKEGLAKLRNVNAQKQQWRNRAILWPLREVGRINEETLKRWSNEPYAPFAREIAEIEAAGGAPYTTGGLGFLKPFKGSERLIRNPDQVLIEQLITTTFYTDKQRVINAICNLPQIATQLQTEIFPTSSSSLHPYKLRTYVNGEPRYYRVPGDIYKAVNEMELKDLGLVLKILAVPKRSLQIGATIHPAFVGKNVWRDSGSMWLHTRSGAIPFLDHLPALGNLIGKSELYYRWLASGGAQSALNSMNDARYGKMYTELLGKIDYKKYLRDPLLFPQRVSELMENSTRLAEFIKAIKSGKPELIAALDSKEVTVNFSRYGAAMQIPRSTAAFYTANIAGPDKTARAFRENPLRYVLKAVIWNTIPAILEFLLFKDDDRWKNLPPWRKYLFMNVPVPESKIPALKWLNKHVIKGALSFPLGWDAGIIFGGLTKAFLEWAYREDPVYMKEWAQMFIRSMLPGYWGIPLPTMVMPILEDQAKYQYFFNRPMPPKSLQLLPPELQYTQYTSETAKEIGKLVNVSPTILENYWFAWTGGSGRDALWFVDRLIEKAGLSKGPETGIPKGPADWPGTRGFLARPPYGLGSHPMQRFYEAYEDAQKQVNALKLREKRGRLTASEVERKKEWIAKYEVLNGIRERVSKLRLDRERILWDKKLDGATKEQLIENLDIAMTMLATKAVASLHGAKLKKGGSQ